MLKTKKQNGFNIFTGFFIIFMLFILFVDIIGPVYSTILKIINIILDLDILFIFISDLYYNKILLGHYFINDKDYNDLLFGDQTSLYRRLRIISNKSLKNGITMLIFSFLYFFKMFYTDIVILQIVFLLFSIIGFISALMSLRTYTEIKRSISEGNI